MTTSVSTERPRNRLRTLRRIIVDDVCGLKGQEEDARISNLVSRLFDEHSAAWEATLLLRVFDRKKIRPDHFPATFRVLYGAIVGGFVAPRSDHARIVMLSRMIRSRSNSLKGEWEAELRARLEKCSDHRRLGDFVAESTRTDNRTALIKVMQRRAGVMDFYGGIEELLFEAKCGQAIGAHLNLAGDAVLAAIKEAARHAEVLRKITLPHGLPHFEKRELASIDQLVLSWQTAVWPQEQQAEVERAAKLVDETVEKLREQIDWRTKRTYGIRLVWYILPREYGWESKRDQLTPLTTVERKL